MKKSVRIIPLAMLLAFVFAFSGDILYLINNLVVE